MVEINLDYKYLVKSKANSYLSLLDVCANPTNVDDILNIICYHITDNSKYPFIQFMIHKVPYCEGFMNEGFVLPAVSLLNKSDTIETIVVNNIKQIEYQFLKSLFFSIIQKLMPKFHYLLYKHVQNHLHHQS